MDEGQKTITLEKLHWYAQHELPRGVHVRPEIVESVFGQELVRFMAETLGLTGDPYTFDLFVDYETVEATKPKWMPKRLWHRYVKPRVKCVRKMVNAKPFVHFPEMEWIPPEWGNPVQGVIWTPDEQEDSNEDS